MFETGSQSLMSDTWCKKKDSIANISFLTSDLRLPESFSAIYDNNAARPFRLKLRANRY
jgi:hypothetical protein